MYPKHCAQLGFWTDTQSQSRPRSLKNSIPDRLIQGRRIEEQQTVFGLQRRIGSLILTGLMVVLPMLGRQAEGDRKNAVRREIQLRLSKFATSPWEIPVEPTRELVAQAESLLGQEDEDTLAITAALAVAQLLTGDVDGTSSLVEKVIGQIETLPKTKIVEAMPVWNNLCRLLYQFDTNRLTRSISERTLNLSLRVFGSDHPSTASAVVALARICKSENDTECRAKCRKEAELFLSRHREASNNETTAFLINLAQMYTEDTDPSKATPLLSQAYAQRKRDLGDASPETNDVLVLLANNHLALHDYADAEREINTAIEAYENNLGTKSIRLLPALPTLVEVLLHKGDTVDAEAAMKRSEAVCSQMASLAKDCLATNLEVFGNTYDKLEQASQSELFYRRAASIREDSYGPDDLRNARTLALLGASLISQKKYQDAEAIFKRVVEIRKQKQGPTAPETKLALLSLARNYFWAGKYVEAGSVYSELVNLHESSWTLPQNESDVLAEYALSETRAGRSQSAKKLYRRALENRKKTEGYEDSGAADLQVRLAELLLLDQDYDEVLSLANQALIYYSKELGDSDLRLLGPLNLLASVYHHKLQVAEALAVQRRAIAVIEKASRSDDPEFLIEWYLLSILEVKNEDIRSACEHFDKFRRLYETHFGQDSLEMAEYSGVFGWWLLQTGEYSNAKPLLENALRIREQSSNPSDEKALQALVRLAQLFEREGDYGPALTLLERARPVAEKIYSLSDDRTIAIIRRLCDVLVAQGHTRQAENVYTEVLSGVSSSSMRQRGTLIHQLATVYARAGNQQQALLMFRKELLLSERSTPVDASWTVRALTGMAESYSRLNDLAHSEILLRRALSVLERARLGNEAEAASTLISLAKVLVSAKREVEAETIYHRAQAILARTSASGDTTAASVSWALGELYFNNHKADRALSEFKRAAAIESNNVTGPLLYGSEFRSAIVADGNLGRVLSITPSSLSNPREALILGAELILRRKGRPVSDDLTRLRRMVEPEYRPDISTLSEIKSKIAELVLNSIGDGNLETKRAELKELQKRANELRLSLSNRSRGFRTGVEPVTVKALQAKIPYDAVLVEFLQYGRMSGHYTELPTSGDPLVNIHNIVKNWSKAHQESPGVLSYVAYLFTCEGDPIRVDLGPAERMNVAAVDFRAAMGNPLNASRVRRLARELDEAVMRPIRRKIGSKLHLLLSPDGDLNLIPFAALRDESGHYLIEKYQITYVDSALVLVNADDRSSVRERSVVYADPMFGNDSQNMTTHRAADRKSVALMRFAPLPATRAEALQIWTMLSNAELKMGSAATKVSLRGLHGPEILHIGTHGIFLMDLPEPEKDSFVVRFEMTGEPSPEDDAMYLSGLVFSDGVLTAAEAAHLDLGGTALVTLSACETGLGDLHNGEGIIGLRRAFVLAGARSVMMSLWKVDDDATRQLMVTFYNSVLAGGSKGEGLRNAQLHMIAQHLEPYYWAAWILSGDSGPL